MKNPGLIYDFHCLVNSALATINRTLEIFKGYREKYLSISQAKKNHIISYYISSHQVSVFEKIISH